MSVLTECKELGANFRRLGRQTGAPRVHAHRFWHTFATGGHRESSSVLDVQYLLGHSTPDMVRRYSAIYNSEKAAHAHEAFSPADRLKERLRGVDTTGRDQQCFATPTVSLRRDSTLTHSLLCIG